MGITTTKMKSKENALLELFFNYPTTHWHFEELGIEAGISRKQLALWLLQFQKQGFITKTKPRKQMPYYVANYQSPHYQNKKKLFALTQLYASGLLDYLSSLRAQAIILFGSFTRWDWHKGSDIDLFFCGDVSQLYLGKYEIALQRDIQVFWFQNKEELQKMPHALLRNIIKGRLLHGNLDFIEVKLHG